MSHDPVERLYEHGFAEVRYNMDYLTAMFSEKCESPIESLMLKALCLHKFVQEYSICWIDGMQAGGGPLPTKGWALYPQKQIGDYRVDFVLMDLDSKVNVVIECDGHDFHERTKEQAMRDRRRDRDLQAKGYLVLRFTGAEIYRNAWQCADDTREKIWEVERNRESPTLTVVPPANEEQAA
jgi:very-short-patch-repair endonuclease